MLHIKNLKKSYGDRLVLQDLSFHINSGEIYGLLGANGAGKTTTINIICNLLKADSGDIFIGDRPIGEATKNLLGIAPQENLLYQSLTCAENLNFYAQIYGLSRKKRHQQIEFSLAAVNLLDRAKNPVETLSGGMQRRMNIAVALVHQPKLLILDEPTTGLDIETRYEIWDLIWQLKNQGMTILLTTHLLDEAQRLCQKIGILKQGKIIAEGNLDELRKYIPAQEIIYLETEQEKEAIARANALGFTYRRYGNRLAFWLPKHFELKEILSYFEEISIDSLSRQSIQLEHIYLEVMRDKL
jgi:ABC-2 type transport system ATP-binding protein